MRGEEESTSYGAPVEPEDLPGHRRHGHMITDIINLPAQGHLKERYVTTGKDGTFRFWQAKVWLQNLLNMFSISVSSCSTWNMAAYAVPADSRSHVLIICQNLSAQATLSASLWLVAIQRILQTKDS